VDWFLHNEDNIKLKQCLLPFLCSIFILFFAGTNPKEKYINQSLINTYYDYDSLDVNQILFPLNNRGSIDESRNSGNLIGFPLVSWDQLGEEQSIVYDQGLWVIGKIGGRVNWTYGTWDRYSVYSPGPIINGQAAMLINPEDSLRYRVYKISRDDDSSNPDYQEWPVGFGAPLDGQGFPRLYADQTLWTVYNGMDSTTYRSLWSDTIDVMPVEINQIAYAREGQKSDAEDIFSNIIFLEYCIINKGMQTIDPAYVGFWTDIDFYALHENFPGVDTLNQLGYCWYGEESYRGYPGPPAVGYVWLYGPAVPSPGSNAVYKGKNRNNYKNLKLSSFHGFDSDFALPWTLDQAWNLAQGLEMFSGNDIIDPTTGQTTTFPYSGDPVSGSGWYWETGGTDAEAGFLMFSGPFSLAPDDTQWVMLALVPGLGRNRYQSIEAMRAKAAILRNMPYDSLANSRRQKGLWFNGEAQCTLEDSLLRANIDSTILQCTLPNSNQHKFRAIAIIKSIDGLYLDSLMLHDDGYHHDGEAGDGLWGSMIQPIVIEREFKIFLIADDLITGASFHSGELKRFRTIGVVHLDHYIISSADTVPNPGDRISYKLTLKNEGIESVKNISTLLVPLDTCTMVPAIAFPPNYGDIYPGELKDSDHGQSVIFSTDCSDSFWTSLRIDIYTDNNIWWKDTISVFVSGQPSSLNEAERTHPKVYALKQNYPNPFNPSTMINYELPITSEVELSIFNLLGQKVTTLVSDRQQAGYYQVEWDASKYASGIYYYHIHTDKYQEIKKMLLLR
jgi:hypothetical protein